VPGVLGRIAQGFPEPGNDRVQVDLEIDKDVAGPEPLLQLFPGDDFSGVLDEEGQGDEQLLARPWPGLRDGRPPAYLSQASRRAFCRGVQFSSGAILNVDWALVPRITSASWTPPRLE
jgi:hypothetical protein